jgi:arylsulfatase
LRLLREFTGVMQPLLRSATLALLLCSSCQTTQRAPTQRAPNIVLIMADDLGYAELGSYGQKKIRTPRLDRLAREGLRFTQFYAGAPVCAPSRCTLLSGLHNGHTAVRDNSEVQPEGQLAIPDATLTLAEMLRARGYRTGGVGKWGLGAPGSEGAPERQGFDHFFGYLCQREAHNFYPDHLWRDGERVELPGNSRGLSGASYSHDLMTDAALDFIAQYERGPFFLYVAYTIPHLALQVPEDSLAEYRGLWDDPPYDGKKGYLPHPTPRAAYAAMVTRLDRDVGRIVDAIDALGLGEDTLILFTSDNGPTYDRLGGSDSEFFESAGVFRGFKGSVYEGGLRVPLIARWNGQVAPNSKSDHVAAFWDFAPTLLDVAGASAQPELDGLSFEPTLTARGTQSQHDYLYWELSSYSGQQALRMGNWKAVRRNMNKGNQAIELFDLSIDPGETRDLAAEQPELIAKARERFVSARTESIEFPLGPRASGQ